MFQSKKNKLVPAGDYVTLEEAVINNETDIRYRCETVDDLVKDKVFTLPQALKAYDISPEQYLGYSMLIPKKQKVLLDTPTFIALMNAMLRIVDFSKSNLDARSKKVVKDIQEFSAVK